MGDQQSTSQVSLVDSLPIMLCSDKRKAKVAKQLSDKGYCSTKNLYYYGVKLHTVASNVKGTLPLSEFVALTPASSHDLTSIAALVTKLRW